MDCKEHDQYLVKLDGTGRLTLRNRRFLRQYTLPTSTWTQPSETMTLADESLVSNTPVDMSKVVGIASQPPNNTHSPQVPHIPTYAGIANPVISLP